MQMQKYKKNTILHSLIMMLAILATIGLGAGIGRLLAYFTASAKANGNMNFANLDLKVMRADTELTSSTYTSTYMTNNLMPGSRIDMNDITINNTGDVSCYALVNYQLEISKNGVDTITYSTWYNLDGELVNSANIESNTTEATLISAGGSKNLSLYYILSGKDITNAYRGATVSTTLTACAVQSENIEGEGLTAVTKLKELVQGNWGTPYTITVVCDDTSNDYAVTGGATIGHALRSAGIDDEYSPYNTCGFFFDNEYLDCVNENASLWSNLTLYTKTATLDKLSFVKSSDSTYYSVRARLNSDNSLDTSISGEVVFPCYYNGLPVTRIYYDSTNWYITGFFYCKQVTNFVFSTAFTTLNFDVCDHCNVESLRINSNMNYIQSAFNGNGSQNLTDIKVSQYNSVYQDLGSNIVYGRSDDILYIAGTDSIIPVGTIQIYSGAFEHKKLTNPDVILPQGVQVLYGNSFAGGNIRSIYLPSSIVEIKTIAFAYCRQLISVTIDSEYVHKNAISTETSACGGVLTYATEVKVLVDIDDGSNTYLNDNFTKVQVGNYNVYTKNS